MKRSFVKVFSLSLLPLLFASCSSEMSEAEWRQSIAINLDGVFHSCRAAMPHLAEGSAIVNIASMAGHRGSYAHAHYAAAKGGVLSLSRSLALELAPRTRVNAVSPGLIEGPMVQPLIARKPELIQNTPMKRLGTAEEVAGVVAFVLQDLHGYECVGTVAGAAKADRGRAVSERPEVGRGGYAGQLRAIVDRGDDVSGGGPGGKTQ